MNDTNLVFIVSLPRSGSTMLQAILSNNEFVDTVSEPWVLLPYSIAHTPSGVITNYNHEWAEVGYTSFFNHIGGRKYVNEHLREFLINLYKPKFGKTSKYFIDKTPRYYEILPFIQEVFPEAKIIILKRNPVSVLKSIIKSWDEYSMRRLLLYHRDLLDAPGLLKNFESTNKNNPNVLAVRYESILEKPEDSIAEIYKWLEIPFDKSVLNYKGNSSYRGAYGDQGTVNSKKELISGVNLANWDTKNRRWRSFLEGYLDHLGVDFLLDYGYPQEYRSRKNHFFDYFLFRAGHISRHKLGLRLLLKLLYFRMRFGLQNDRLNW